MAKALKKIEARREDKINIRAVPHIKDTIEQAASLKGQTLSDYMLSFCYEKALEDIDRFQKIVLDNKDFEILMSALNSTCKPNAKLKDAFVKYKNKY